MDRLDAVRLLARIVELGSFSAAARALRISQSTASKWVAALEAELGVALLDRTTRSVRPTDAGAKLLGRADALVGAWDAAVAEAQARALSLTGLLRVSLPVVFGQRYVVPLVAAFARAHPALRLELDLDDRYVSLLDDRFDVVVRVGVPVDTTLRARQLASTPRRLVASPGYVAERGRPEAPSALAGHACLVHGGVEPATIWVFERGEERARARVSGQVMANHSEALLTLARDGAGVALLADWLVAEDVAAGRLVTLLDDWEAPSAPIMALMAPGPWVQPRVRAFVDHLAASLVPTLAR